MTPEELARERRVLRALLPSAAFRPNPSKLAPAAVHAAAAIVLWAVTRHTTCWWLLAALSLAVGHCLFVMALFAHELSHGSVVREGPFRRVLEILFWGPSLISPTVWRAVHNRTHHHETNTPRDPDRRFLIGERGPATWWYTKLFYPHRSPLGRNPFVLLNFLAYVVRQTAGGLAGPCVRMSLLPSRTELSSAERLRMVGDLAAILGLQVGLYCALGRNAVQYAFAGPLAVCASSAFVMAYVFTNHFLRPIRPISDPVANTTSVVVGPLLDRVHLHFSYHTEHHLFPSMDSRFFPELSRLLAARMPGQYQRIPIGEAWRQLWHQPQFAANVPGGPPRSRNGRG